MKNESYQSSYFSFYSTYRGSTTTDSVQMVIPIDDHGFHRGDGVFEAMKWFGDKVWLLDAHLSRLQNSCEKIGLKLPLSILDLAAKIHELIHLAKKDKGLVRVFATRGPGSFGVNPYESTAPQIYIITTELKEWSEERVKKGASIMRSRFAAKKGMFAQVKSLNYLPNVLMKREAIDSGFDFALGIGEQGEVLESSTENLGFIKGTSLVTPLFDSTLRGTTLLRLTEIISESTDLVWQSRAFLFEELLDADEVFLVGTTIDVLPVTRIENQDKSQINKALQLRALLQKDQK